MSLTLGGAEALGYRWRLSRCPACGQLSGEEQLGPPDLPEPVGPGPCLPCLRTGRTTLPV